MVEAVTKMVNIARKLAANEKIGRPSEEGYIPRGLLVNEIRTATRFGRYDIKNVDALNPVDYEVSHEGYDPVFIRQNPNRLVPVDVLRDLERERKIGRLHDKFYSTNGVASIVKVMRKIGQTITEELKAEGVSGVLLTSTWGTSTRCGATLTKEIERIGLPTVHICAITPVAQMVGSNR